MPISPWYCKPEREFNFSSCFEWNKFLKRFSGSTKECATEDQILNHDLVNISFFKIDELGLVGTWVKHSFRIYMGCYLQFWITKKLRPVNKNLSKVHFFHILSAHAKGLIAIDRNGFRRMKEKGQIYKIASDFLSFAWGLSYDFWKFSDVFTSFFRLWKTITKSLGKN